MTTAKHRTTGDLAELTDQLTQLRELIREAHCATKDLRAEIKEARALREEFADACARAAFDAANDEMARWAGHIQAEMNDRARDLNRAVTAAREHIAHALIPRIVNVGEDGRLSIEFEGSLFDDQVPTTGRRLK